MGANKPDIYPLDGKFDDYDQTMMISTNVKHIMLIADIIHTVETLFYICKTFPLRLLYNLHPVLQSGPGIRESGDVFF